MNRQSLTQNKKAVKKLKECIALGYTDKQIQEKLTKECDYKWSVQTIRKNRRKMGVDRTSGEKQELVVGDLSSSLPPHGLSEEEKAIWFIKKFKRSYLFDMLQQQFNPEEVDFYLEEYGRICCQFEDIVTSEFFQIEKYLKHRILINRQLIFTNVLQEDIKELISWTTDHPIEDGGSQEIMKERVNAVLALDGKQKRLQEAHIRYDKLIGEEEKMLKSLNATRASRIEQLSGGKENFFNLIVAMQHSEEERNKQGRHAELTRIASENIAKEFRKPISFPDGEEDLIITDHQSVAKNEGDD